MTYIPTIPTAYHVLCRAFDQRELLGLLRQWFKQAPHDAGAVYDIPQEYQRHVQTCRRVAQYHDADGECYDVMVVHVNNPNTWIFKQRLLHGVAVKAMRRCTHLPDFNAIVAYVAPDGMQWRMQYIAQEIESVEDPHTARFTVRERVTAARDYLIDVTTAHGGAVPFAYWDAIKAATTPVRINHIKEACMALPSTPTEAFERAYAESIAAIEAYERLLQTTGTTLSFAQRAKIYEQLARLHQLADQWQQAAHPLLQLMRIDNVQVISPDQKGPPDGVPLTLSDSWRFRKPMAIQHNGKIYPVKHWQGVYATVIHAFISAYGAAYINGMNGTMAASSRPFFSQQAEIYDRAAQVEGWYYEATQSADQMAAHIRRMYQLYTMPLDTFVVWVHPQ